MEGYIDDYTGYTPSILEDFAEIRDKFVNGASASFKSFLALWKELKFEYLFMGIDDPKYGFYYGKDLLRAALGYTDPANMPLVRILGIYLCYGIYVSYPFHDVIKTHIRMIPEEYLALGTFVKEINDQVLAGTAPEKEVWHVVHVFNMLRKEKAFCLALTKMELFPPSHRLLNLEEEDERENVKRPSAVNKIFNSMVLSELEATHQEYEMTKQEAVATNPSLQLLPEGDIVKKLREILGDRKGKKRNSCNKRISNADNSEDEADMIQIRLGNSRTGKKCPKAPNKRRWRMEQAPAPSPKRARKNSTVVVQDENEVSNEDDLAFLMDLM